MRCSFRIELVEEWPIRNKTHPVGWFRDKVISQLSETEEVVKANMGNDRIRAELRLETSNPKVCGDSGNRVWVDVWVDGIFCQPSPIYSGCLEAAEGIVAGTIRMTDGGYLIDVATGEPHHTCHLTRFDRKLAARAAQRK